jgi:hypothetical protein
MRKPAKHVRAVIKIAVVTAICIPIWLASSQNATFLEAIVQSCQRAILLATSSQRA